MTEIAYLLSRNIRVVLLNGEYEVQSNRFWGEAVDGSTWRKLYRRADRAKAIMLMESYA